MLSVKTESKKVSEQNNDDRSDFDSKLVNELDLFVSKLTNPDKNHESLQKINEDLAKLDSSLDTLAALKTRAENQIKTSNEAYSALLSENESLKHKLGLK